MVSMAGVKGILAACLFVITITFGLLPIKVNRMLKVKPGGEIGRSELIGANGCTLQGSRGEKRV